MNKSFFTAEQNKKIFCWFLSFSNCPINSQSLTLWFSQNNPILLESVTKSVKNFDNLQKVNCRFLLWVFFVIYFLDCLLLTECLRSSLGLWNLEQFRAQDDHFYILKVKFELQNRITFIATSFKSVNFIINNYSYGLHIMEPSLWRPNAIRLSSFSRLKSELEIPGWSYSWSPFARFSSITFPPFKSLHWGILTPTETTAKL